MSKSGVKCLSTPCVTSCPDAEVVIHPPPLHLTLPGMILATSPSKTLVETETACITNGSDGCSTAVVTKSSGPRALCGSTPCCISTTPDSQIVIKPPPVCIKIPGAVLTSFPNECLIATSQPCIPAGSKPPAITRSTSVTDGAMVSAPLSRSCSVPCGLDRASHCATQSTPTCVTQGSSSKVVIYPPAIVLTIPGPVIKIAAGECAVEVHNPCENLSAITSGEQHEVKALMPSANSCTEVCGLMDTSPCVSQGPEMTITIQPPPIAVDLPGPILKVSPEECKVETISPCPPENPALCESSTPALTNSETSLCTVKRPLPDIRRPPRPWAEIYSRSVTPRSLTACPPPIIKHRNSFSSASCY